VQNFWACHQGAREFHPLQHATRELVRVGALEALESCKRQILIGETLAFSRREVTQHERHVLLDRQPGKDRVTLKHINTLATRSLYRPAIYCHFSAIRPIEPRENVQESCLATP